MHDQPAQRGAALARRAHRAEQDGAQCHVQVGVGRDDHRVVAAELEDAAAEARRHARADRAAHARRAGGRDQAIAGLSTNASACAVPPITICARPSRRALAKARDGALQRPEGREPRQRRLLGGLEDDRVAAHQRDRRIPREHRAREVEGGDDRHRPQRVVLLHDAVARPLRHDGLAMELPRQAERELADVHALLHLAQAFLRDLADLDRDDAADVGLGAAQFLAPQPHQFAACRRGHLAPLMEGGLRGGDQVRHRRHRRSRAAAPVRAPSMGERTDSVPPARSAARDAAAFEEGRVFEFDHVLASFRVRCRMGWGQVCAGAVPRRGPAGPAGAAPSPSAA